MDFSDDYGIQSGFIAQDIWYNAPELRHLVYQVTMPLKQGDTSRITYRSDTSKIFKMTLIIMLSIGEKQRSVWITNK